MHIRGLIRYFLVLGTWMLGAFFVPAALVCLTAQWTAIPVMILLVYYPFRILFPAQNWETFIEYMCLNEDPYFNKQEVVFDNGAVAPKPNSKVLIAVAPHGILTLGWNSLLSSKEIVPSKVRWLVAEVLSYLPFISDFCRWSNMWPCSTKVMTGFMEKGENIALIPGGFQEATLYMHGRHRLYIKQRKGFIKYALQYGYQVQPVYVFGEEWSYWQMALYGAKSFALWLNKYNVPGTVFIGKFLFFPDNNLDLITVVGRPLDLPHIASPSRQDVDKYHALYVEALTALFHKYKYRYNIHRYAAEVEEVVVSPSAGVVAVTDSSMGSETGSLSRSNSSGSLISSAPLGSITPTSAAPSTAASAPSGIASQDTTGSSIDELSAVGASGRSERKVPVRRSSRTQQQQVNKEGFHIEYRAKLPSIRLEVL